MRPRFWLRIGTSGILLFISVLHAEPAAKTAAPLAVDKEPRHKTVFENDYVRIIDVQFPAGDTTLYHTHSISSVVVRFTDTTIATQEWGSPAAPPQHVRPGDTRYAPYDDKPLTHRVTNRGPGVFRVFDIELLRPRHKTPPPWPEAAAGTAVAWVEKLVRLCTIAIAPGQRIQVPSSPQAHLLIDVTGATRVTRPGRDLSPCDYVFFAPQTKLEVANSGKAPASCVLLELQ